MSANNQMLWASQPHDPSYSSVVLLNHYDGANGGTTFTDNSKYAHVPTLINTPTTSTTQSFFGGSALKLSGTNPGDALTYVNATEFQITSGDRTIEAAVYLTAFSAVNYTSYGYAAVIVAKDFNSTFGREFIFEITGTASSWTTLTFAQFAGDSLNTIQFVQSGSFAFSLNTWYRVAYTRSGSTNTLYVNGSSINTLTNSSNGAGTTKNLTVGYTAFNGEAYFPGYIDELRITKGVARYTGASYALATAPFPNS